MRRIIILLALFIAVPCQADPVSELTRCIADRNEIFADRAVLAYQYEQLAKAFEKRVRTIHRLKKVCGKRCKKVK